MERIKISCRLDSEKFFKLKTLYELTLKRAPCTITEIIDGAIEYQLDSLSDSGPGKASDKAKAAKAEYQRAWRRRNPEKMKKYDLKYWLKKAGL